MTISGNIGTVMRYSGEQEILDNYGLGFLTEAQYDRYRELYEKGRAALEDLPPTQNKLTLQLVRRIIADLDAERREWEFSALSPEDQRAELEQAQRAQNEWKEKIAELNRRLDWDDPQEQKEGVK